MSGSTFEQKVDLNSAKVGGPAFFREGATFKGEVKLTAASIGSILDMSRSTFEGDVDLETASIGSNLDFSAASFAGRVELTGSQVIGELRLGSSRHSPTRWEQAALLVLRNTHAGALQDWWQDSSDNSWPKVLELEGFTFDRLGGLYGEGKAADMMVRPSECYVEWLGKDSRFSPQPYEHLASWFRRAGEPGKANDILYAARERRRRLALSAVDDHGHPKDREVLKGVGLWMLRSTIGYGLGNGYFRVLRWVGGLTLLGMFVLIAAGQLWCSPARWPPLFFASLDQLLPIITLNKAHDALIFGDSSANPPVKPQPCWIQYYFYVHMIVGWVLGSFIVAGLAGLTQRN
jgi:hypothetical protein